MSTPVILAHATSNLESWGPLAFLGTAFAVIVGVLTLAGSPGAHPSRIGRFLLRTPRGMERITRIPGAGWALCSIGLSMIGLAAAGAGFYSDVSWHIDLGRDEILFTAPHTMIVAGLVMIATSAAIGVLYASLAGVPTRLRWRGVRLPWSMLVLGLLGASALVGFPLDEIWHHQYGVDVTMWSPTHLLLILGATLSPIAWLIAIGEAGIRREDGIIAKAARLLVVWLVLMGLNASLGEFDFGVPQFQQLYHPVLIALISGFAFVIARLVLGPWRSLAIALLTLVVDVHETGAALADGHVRPRNAAIFMGCALAVELAALLAGTTRRLRFAVASGVGVATLGLGVEWFWNTRAHQPWTTALLPEAVLVGAVAAVGGAVIAVALASAANREPSGVPRWALVTAAGLVLVGMVLPLPRRVGEVGVHMTLQPSGTSAFVTVELDPPDAADGARWFQTMAWQGGGLFLAEMVQDPSAPGRYVSDRAMPVTGTWKTLVRLHRGAELMSVPVYLPADPEIDAPEVPAADRTMRFQPEGEYLLREARPGPAWFAILAYSVIGLIATVWFGSMAAAAAGTRGAPVARVPETAAPAPASGSPKRSRAGR